MTTRYRLVFRGNYLPGMNATEVVVNLAQLFGVTRDRIQSLLAIVPSIIKGDLDVHAGNRYQEALAEAGLITHLELADSPLSMSNWDGVERRKNSRRIHLDRRERRRGTAIQPDRRVKRGRRSTDV